MKAVLLARVSLPEQADGYSLDAQISRVRQYCASRNLEVITGGEFVFDESSTRGDRKKFMEAIRFCKAQSALLREPVALVADCVDRVQRSFKEWEMLDKLRRGRILELHLLREGLIIGEHTPPAMLSIWEMMIVTAHSYVLNLSANVTRAIDQKAASGEWSCFAPVGYLNRRDPSGRAHIIVDDKTAPIIRRLFEHYATGLYSLRDMVKFADDWGLRSVRTNRPYTVAVIQKILVNPFYYGEMLFRGKLMPHIYPPLVSREVWNACDRHRRGLGKSMPKYGQKPFIYRGLIHCANTRKLCSTQRKKDKYNYTGCWDTSGNMVYVREEDITEQISQVLDTFVLPADRLDEVANFMKITKSAETTFHESELRRLRMESGRTDDRRRALINAFIDRQIGKDVYDEKLLELNRQRAEYAAQISAHENADDGFNDTLVSLFTAAQGYGDDWRWYMDKIGEIADSGVKSSKIDSGRTFLKAVFRTLELKDGNLGFSLHAPFEALLKIAKNNEWWG